MNNGRTLKIFLVDGSPNGLWAAEIMNWTGHVITGPRTRLAQLLERPEAKRSAVYFLVGPESVTGLGTLVYIGETEDAKVRLAQHNRPEESGSGGGKDFWERVCVVTSKDANLTKGHIKYLESRLITRAKEAGRCDLINSTDPEYDGLPEADRSDMEFFLEQIQTLLPVLGFDFMRLHPRLTATVPDDPGITPPVSPVFTGDVPLHGITARGQERDGEFVVFTGSLARRQWEGVDSSYTKLFEDLSTRGVLNPTPDGRHKTFTQDFAFSSVSAAASVVSGRNANGRTHWVVEGTNQTYGQWAAEKIAKAQQASAQTAPNSAQ